MLTIIFCNTHNPQRLPLILRLRPTTEAADGATIRGIFFYKHHARGKRPMTNMQHMIFT